MWKTIAQVENFQNTLPRQANPDWGVIPSTYPSRLVSESGFFHLTETQNHDSEKLIAEMPT